MIEYSPAVILSALLSWALEWLPPLRTWWDGLSAARKAMLNALGVALISIGVMLYKCRWGTVCPADVGQAIIEFLLVALLSLGANQAVYRTVRRENYIPSLGNN